MRFYTFQVMYMVLEAQKCRYQQGLQFGVDGREDEKGFLLGYVCPRGGNLNHECGCEFSSPFDILVVIYHKRKGRILGHSVDVHSSER